MGQTLSSNVLFSEEYGIHEIPSWVDDTYWMDIMKKTIPKIQIKKLLGLGLNDIKTEEIAAFVLVKLRWGNKICLCCGNRKENAKFFSCVKCHMVHYCSERCMHLDFNNHSRECGNVEIEDHFIRENNRYHMPGTTNKKI